MCIMNHEQSNVRPRQRDVRELYRYSRFIILPTTVVYRIESTAVNGNTVPGTTCHIVVNTPAPLLGL
jgi:hypothetical protein